MATANKSAADGNASDNARQRSRSGRETDWSERSIEAEALAAIGRWCPLATGRDLAHRLLRARRSRGRCGGSADRAGRRRRHGAEARSRHGAAGDVAGGGHDRLRSRERGSLDSSLVQILDQAADRSSSKASSGRGRPCRPPSHPNHHDFTFLFILRTRASDRWGARCRNFTEQHIGAISHCF